MTTVTVRLATPADDTFIGSAFTQMWRDNGIAESDLVDDASSRVQEFLAEGRERLELRAFVAQAGANPVGCAVAQRFAGLYPDVLKHSLRKYGYIWGVWVAPEHRRQGLGRRLTEHCVQALRETGCTHALLHAAPMGRSVYEGLGFVPTNELKLELAGK